MEKRNMILLTVIAIATLLVAVVGATFAYFTASTTTSGTAPTTTVTTNKLDGANLTFTETGEELDMLEYPGGLGIYGATATIAKQEPGTDNNDYKATFDLEITYTNQTNTALEWELWMLEKKIGELDFAKQGGFESITKCGLKTKEESGTTYYWYADADDAGTDYNTEQCDGKNIREAVSGAGGTLIAYGDLPTGKTEAKITKSTVKGDTNEIRYSEEEAATGDEDLKEVKKLVTSNQLGGRTLSTKTGKDSKVYYLVVKYPNKASAQNADAGKQISVKLSVAEGANSVLDQAA